MAKKRTPERPDNDRRLRQSERLARLLRVLHLISGKGRWDADGLAEELECSRRTIFRMLQTLSMAGVPWYLDSNSKAYRVRAGYKFPLIESDERSLIKTERDEVAEQVIESALRLSESLNLFIALNSKPKVE